MAAAPGDEPRFTLGAELDRLDDKVAGLKGAFRANQERAIRAAGRARIIATGLTGMAAAGRETRQGRCWITMISPASWTRAGAPG